MSTCFYITDRTIDKDMNVGQNWCAGGRSQQAQINFGALPAEARELVSQLEKERPVYEGLPDKLGAYVAGLEMKAKGPEPKGHPHE
jgi:hypothetical protein